MMLKKYPRTFHFSFSPNIGRDDRSLTPERELSLFENKEIVMTEKLDGENTTIEKDCIFARSISLNNSTPWRTLVRKLYGEINFRIPEFYRICGENMQGIHSIEYKNLTSAFYVFVIFNSNLVLSWNDTIKWCDKLNLTHVPVIYRGMYDKKLILKLFESYCKYQPNEVEGFVVRNSNSFLEEDFHNNVAKYVRKNHIQTDEHWTKNWREADIKWRH
jgi:hypothetical protein